MRIKFAFVLIIFSSVLFSMFSQGKPSEAQLIKVMGFDSGYFSRMVVETRPEFPGQWIFAGINNIGDEFFITVALFDQNSKGIELLSISEPIIYNLEKLPLQIIGLEVDKAYWQINPTDYAFGIRITSTDGAGTSRNGEQNLYLFVCEKLKLKCILRDISSIWSGERDEKTLELSNQTMINHLYRFSKQQSYGYFNLIIESKDMIAKPEKIVKSELFVWNKDNGYYKSNAQIE